MDQPPIVDGHGYCRCGRLHSTILLSRSGGTCPECEHQLDDAVERIELSAKRGGGVIPVNRRPKRTRKGAASRRRRVVVAAARQAAMRRLKNIHPEEYNVLYAQERAKRGLETYPPEGEHFDAVDGDRLIAKSLMGAN